MRSSVCCSYLSGPRNVEISKVKTVTKTFIVHNLYRGILNLRRLDNLSSRFPDVLTYRLLDVTDDSVVDKHI